MEEILLECLFLLSVTVYTETFEAHEVKSMINVYSM